MISPDQLCACFSRICMSDRLELPFRPLIKEAFFEYRTALQVSAGTGLELTTLGRKLAPGWFIFEECGFGDIGANLRLTLSRIGVTNRRHRVMMAASKREPVARVAAPKRITPKLAASRARQLARSAGLKLGVAA
jgi:hypothetical protein